VSPSHQFPIERLALDRTVRLVPTARLRDPVLRGLGGSEFQDDFAEIEGATNGRLQAQQIGAESIQPDEFIAGIPHSHFINAAFSYWRPREINRFNGPGRGAWYASLHVRTSIAEVAFHMTRELERINDFNTVVDYSEMFASFAGEFIDLRKVQPKPTCLDPDPIVGYPAGNVLADERRAQGHNGIIYPSARDPRGTCLVALWPHAVQSVAQGDIIRLTWAGNPKPSQVRIT
jgi:RES domain-containing protein